MRRRFSAFTPYLLLALLTAFVFYKLAFTDMIMARGDAYSYFYPYWDARNAAFQQGQLPLWTPDIFMGAPLLANPQLGTFYPPNWLMTWLPAPDGIRYSVLLHTFWAAAGMYMLFLAVTRHAMPDNPRKKIVVPALCAAVIYAFGGAFTGHVEQINQLQGLSWLPWLFYFLQRILAIQPSAFDLTLQPHLTPQPPLLKERGSQIPIPIKSGRDIVMPSGSTNHLNKKLMSFLFLTACFALQIFSGHTQTVFISGVGLAVYALVFSVIHAEAYRAGLWRFLQALGWLLAVAIGGIVLALPQILPTLELTGMSYRGGSGFTAQQATAFSLPLRYIGRALLPSYDGQLFTEYMATPGVIGLALALLAIGKILTQRRRGAETQPFHLFGFFSTHQHSSTKMSQHSALSTQHYQNTSFFHQYILIWAIIAFIGLFFAIGRFNPVYLLLAELPGFDLFRVPARWLALFGIGVAMLAGLGVQQHLTEDYRPHQQNNIPSERLLIFGIMAVLVAFMFLTRFVFSIVPEDIFGSAQPTNTTLMLWGITLIGLCFVLVFKKWRFANWLIFPLLLLELFAASQIMPFNDLAPRDVYTGQRLSISQMQVFNEGQPPPGRILAINNLLFDIGDKRVLEDRFSQLGMDEQAIHTAFTAIKKQELIFHNLPLTWGIPSVDGMDGGVLPTIYYSQFTSLLLPEGTLRTTDGRIGELLALPECRGACIPDDKYLNMMDVQYLITDKVNDIWHDDVAYDTAWRFISTTERPTRMITPHPFIATQVNVLYTNYDDSDIPPVIKSEETQPLQAKGSPVNLGDFWLATYSLTNPQSLTEISVSSAVGVTTFFAVTALDNRTGDFVWLTPLRIKLMLSSDIKIYDYNAVHPALDETFLARRAWVMNGVIALPDTWQGSEDARHQIQQAQFSPNTTVMIHSNIPPQATTGVMTPSPTITEYTPKRVEISLDAMPTDGYLVLSDAWYPGWKATVNGQPAPVYRANVMFRAVPIPAGKSAIVFYFEPDLWYIGMAFGGLAWGLWGIAMIWQFQKNNRNDSV